MEYIFWWDFPISLMENVFLWILPNLLTKFDFRCTSTQKSMKHDFDDILQEIASFTDFDQFG